MKKNIVALSFFSFLVICGSFYLLVSLLTKYKEQDLEKLTIEKTRSAVTVIIPSINKALENGDDIALLINIESLSRFENIASSFILDQNNKVIIHNKTDQWNTERKSDIYERAAGYGADLVQATTDKELMLFSAPLEMKHTLCCIISMQKAHENAKYWKIRYFTVAAAFALLITIILYFLSKLFVLLPYRRTKAALEKSSAEEIRKDGYNEITDIFLTENEKAAKKISMLEEDNESLSKIIEHYSGAKNEEYAVFIILNSLNNIVYAVDETGIFLKEEFSKGSHILETAANAEIIKLIEKAGKKPGEEVFADINNIPVTAISIGKEDEIYGTIIKNDK